VTAFRSEDKSQLPIGVKKVIGEFERGAAVTCVNEAGQDIARGLCNYSAEEARRIAGHASQKIETLLGYGGDGEIIHRDDLVLP
jgi:glutamate 5-kinase